MSHKTLRVLRENYEYKKLLKRVGFDIFWRVTDLLLSFVVNKWA
jgi:hypothetical protein